MALTQRHNGHAAASMRRVALSQLLIAVLAAAMVLVVIGPILLGIAIHQRMIAPPELDVRFGGSHVVAYSTQAPDCIRYLTSCPPELIARPTQNFYVIWVLSKTGQPAPPDERETATRLLTLALRQP